MNLGSYNIERGSRKKLFEGMISHYEALFPSSETFYCLGVAEKDYRANKEKPLEYFIYSAMIMHNYDHFKELYYGASE